MIAAQIGKKVGEHVYIHKDVIIYRHATAAIQKKVERAEVFARRKSDLFSFNRWDLVKLHNRLDEVSFLTYRDFFHDPHPQLERVVRVVQRSLNPIVITYYKQNGYDVPILHRKELMVDSSCRESIEKWFQLTEQEEKVGLYTNTAIIGRLGQWKLLLGIKGVMIRGGVLYWKGPNGVRGRV